MASCCEKNEEKEKQGKKERKKERQYEKWKKTRKGKCRELVAKGGAPIYSYMHGESKAIEEREKKKKEFFTWIHSSFLVLQKKSSLAQAAATIYTHADEQAPDKMWYVWTYIDSFVCPSFSFSRSRSYFLFRRCLLFVMCWHVLLRLRRIAENSRIYWPYAIILKNIGL